MNFFTKLKTDPHVFEIKGKTHRISQSSDLFEASFRLSPADKDEFQRRSMLIEDELRNKLAIVDATYDEAVAKAKATARAAHAEARAAYDAAKWALAGDFFRLPTPEQIAVAETPVNQVVRMPSPVPVAEPQGA